MIRKIIRILKHQLRAHSALRSIIDTFLKWQPRPGSPMASLLQRRIFGGTFIFTLFIFSSWLSFSLVGHLMPAGKYNNIPIRMFPNTLTEINMAFMEKRKAMLQNSSLDNHTDVLIVSHTGADSPMLAQLFNLDPSALVWYEPLDALYSHIYGLPSEIDTLDVLYHNNLTMRRLSKSQRFSIAWYFSMMLSCDLESMATETMSHPYLAYSKSLVDYNHCYREQLRNASVSLTDCKTYIAEYCGVSLDDATANRCQEYISSARKMHSGLMDLVSANFFMDTLFNRRIYSNSRSHKMRSFFAHKVCLSDVSNHVSACIQEATRACQARNVHVLYTTSLNMADVEIIIQQIPTMFVVHVVRDPRDTVMSISMADIMANSANWTEAICQRMLVDLKMRHQLEVKYPGVFLQVKHEDVVSSAFRVGKILYEKLGKIAPYAEWEATIGAENGSYPSGYNRTASGSGNAATGSSINKKYDWQGVKADGSGIPGVCLDVLQMLGYSV